MSVLASMLVDGEKDMKVWSGAWEFEVNINP